MYLFTKQIKPEISLALGHVGGQVHLLLIEFDNLLWFKFFLHFRRNIMQLPIYSLRVKLGWLTTRIVPLSESDVTQLIQILNSSQEFSDFTIKFTGLTQNNSFFYYQVFNNLLSNQDFVDISENTNSSNTVRDAVEYVIYHDVELDAYCISTIFSILGNYPQFSGYSAQLQGLTPSTTQQYTSVFNELLNLPQFVFDASTYLVETE